MKVFAKAIVGRKLTVNDISVRLQHHETNQGYTDIEIIGRDIHLIVEAKRGWSLPSLAQLRKYARRIEREREHHRLIVLAECSPDYGRRHLPRDVSGVPLTYISWKQIYRMSQNRSRKTLKEKWLIAELQGYLKGVMSMQDQYSNMVFIVPLRAGTPKWSKLSWIDIVEKKRRYFHPFGKSGWPKEPPNYIGFRYEGGLQLICHIESYDVVEEMHSHISEIKAEKWDTTMLYKLGKPIRPAKPVKTGGLYGPGHHWAMLDTLLTCKTVREARDLTQKRLKAVGESG